MLDAATRSPDVQHISKKKNPKTTRHKVKRHASRAVASILAAWQSEIDEALTRPQVECLAVTTGYESGWC
jgi:hypothetical protein